LLGSKYATFKLGLLSIGSFYIYPPVILQLSLEGQQQLKEQVLLAVQQEESDSVRSKVCEMAAEVARNLIDEDGNNQWPEFLQFLFQCANAPNPVLKESALRMFT
jgi:hypothetical protein